MKSYKKSLLFFAAVAVAGAALGAFFTKTEKGKQLLAEMEKRKHCNEDESI